MHKLFFLINNLFTLIVLYYYAQLIALNYSIRLQIMRIISARLVIPFFNPISFCCKIFRGLKKMSSQKIINHYWFNNCAVNYLNLANVNWQHLANTVVFFTSFPRLVNFISLIRCSKSSSQILHKLLLLYLCCLRTCWKPHLSFFIAPNHFLVFQHI